MEDGATGRDLSEAEPLETESTPALPPVAAGAGGVVTVMHVDVEGSTALTARVGDDVQVHVGGSRPGGDAPLLSQLWVQ